MNKKLILGILVLGFSLHLPGQKLEKYFDYNWKPCDPDMARFYSLIENTDSGWLRQDYFIIESRMQMKGLFRDSACTIKNGGFYFFHANGQLQSVGRYKDNKKEGQWLLYYPNGFMSDSSVYAADEITGISLKWHNNGFLSDSTEYKEDGTGISFSWFDDGSISSAGRLSASHKPFGKWQYFHRNGKLSAVEVYDNGRLVDRKYFSEDGTPKYDISDETTGAFFPGGVGEWLKFLDNTLYFPRGYKLVNGDKAAIVVDFTIDENGNLKDVNLQTPFHPVFNDIVIKGLKKSPKWIPAMDHNRRVKYHHIQTIIFHDVNY
jgi:hypothetical protein